MARAEHTLVPVRIASPRFSRAHGQWPFREVFNIAPESHPAYKSIVAYTKLRYNAMPYIYSLSPA